jgi:hypothetical protein
LFDGVKIRLFFEYPNTLFLKIVIRKFAHTKNRTIFVLLTENY